MPNRVLDLEDYLDKAERDYLLEGSSEFFFPIRKKASFPDFYAQLEYELRAQDILSVNEYRSVKEGYTKVSRPAMLKLSLDGVLKCRPHLQALAREVATWRIDFANLNAEAALRTGYRDLTAFPSLTRSCFEVLKYLIGHREQIRGLLARQVQHSESSKLIGREQLLLRLFGFWRGESATWKQFYRHFELLERPTEFRFYAPNCQYLKSTLSDFHGVLNPDWANRFNFDSNHGTLIVENLETFYSEASKSQNYLVIWGSGWKAVLLRSIQGILPPPILYWGDIDKEGYEIYGALKAYLPKLQPTLMDRQTMERHLNQSTPKEVFWGPYQSAGDLQVEYHDVCQRGICIEQEKIHDRPY